LHRADLRLGADATCLSTAEILMTPCQRGMDRAVERDGANSDRRFESSDDEFRER
jgi:hypothetical protein